MTIGKHGLPGTPEGALNRVREVISKSKEGTDITASPEVDHVPLDAAA
jgi:hypothetical protein